MVVRKSARDPTQGKPNHWYQPDADYAQISRQQALGRLILIYSIRTQNLSLIHKIHFLGKVNTDAGTLRFGREVHRLCEMMTKLDCLTSTGRSYGEWMS